MIAALFTVAGVTLTLLQCLEKWGLLERYQVYRKRWMPEAGCHLCLSFWIAWPVLALYLALLFCGVEVILIPWALAGFVNLAVSFHKALKP